VDHISDINLTYTEHARRYLLAEGIKQETVIKTGSPMKEVLEYHMPKIKGSDVLRRLGVEEGNYFVVSAHREENIDNEENFRDLLGSLRSIVDKFGKSVVVSTHPRTRKKLETTSRKKALDKIRFLKPLGFLDYVHLEMKAYCVVSDSGTITEESSILGFPAVTIRQAHERPEGMDEGTLIMCGLKAERVIASIEIVTSQHPQTGRTFKLVQDYDTETVSKKVLRIIISYTDYVNRLTWHKC
jgi:UDP-N-acetylglucosamine 2-epimerase (non-hydrolysing)